MEMRETCIVRRCERSSGRCGRTRERCEMYHISCPPPPPPPPQPPPHPHPHPSHLLVESQGKIKKIHQEIRYLHARDAASLIKSLQETRHLLMNIFLIFSIRSYREMSPLSTRLQHPRYAGYVTLLIQWFQDLTELSRIQQVQSGSAFSPFEASIRV